MRLMPLVFVPITAMIALTDASFVARLRAQTTAASGPSTAAVKFDVVSIKRNVTEDHSGSMGWTTDGSFRLMNSGLSTLVTIAYPSLAEYVGLPDWAHERYDVIARTAGVTPTTEQRKEMMKALLAERFRFAAHTETREKPTFDLVLARKDGRLGSGLSPTGINCDDPVARRAAAAEALPPGMRVPRCSFGMTGDVLEGDLTMAGFASTLKMYAGQTVIDKTGLTGRYRITLTANLFATELVDANIDSPASIFTVLPEQLGLKLQPSKAMLDVLVIDRMERPTEN
jgi:uncharacterized protein (TIGR03435 family)